MATDRKHSSDVSSEQEVIRRTEKLVAQMFGLDEQNAKAYKALAGQIWALEKRLEDYHFEYVKLKKKVNLLEAELEDLDECVDRGTVPLLIGKKGKGSSKSSSSESSSSDSDIDEIVNMIKHQRIKKQIRKCQAQRKVSEEKCISSN